MEKKEVEEICNKFSRQFSLNFPLEIVSFSYNQSTEELEVSFSTQANPLDAKSFNNDISVVIDESGRIIFFKLKNVAKYYPSRQTSETLNLDE